ncbi:MAG: DinB family protein [Anaerolineales bacterium]|nr:DinB family protein [Anaerolineales bacterium]
MLYNIYLEINPAGTTLAHIPELPGLCLRGDSQEAALAALPQAIDSYFHWLQQHGEPLPRPDTITWQVVETIHDFGPFQRGDKAALFAADKAPLSREALETHLRYAGYGRADLLALTRHLPEQLLEWQPNDQTMSIRQILSHVGGSAQWYVSRLVEAETLPPEWEHDDELGVFDFLALQQRTVSQRLRQLTEEELVQVTFPAMWSYHPDEMWTARKALRRLVEHELEHVAQVRQVLAQWRAHFLAHLAAERAELLFLLIGLDEETLASRPVFDNSSAKELLAHIAAWDTLHTGRIRLAAQGRAAEIPSLVLDEYNAQLQAQHQGWPLAEALAVFTTARQEFLNTLAGLSDEELHRPVTLPNGDTTSIRTWGLWRTRHDAAHAADLQAWRKQQQFAPAVGPKALLLAALQASRAEMATLAALLSPAGQTTHPLINTWTLKDIVGHLADWEAYGAAVLQAGRLLPMGYDEDDDRWNAAHAATRATQSWGQVWSDFQAARQALLAHIIPLAPNGLATLLPDERGAGVSIYNWVLSFLEHEREHALAMRAALMPHLPERLRQPPAGAT